MSRLATTQSDVLNVSENAVSLLDPPLTHYCQLMFDFGSSDRPFESSCWTHFATPPSFSGRTSSRNLRGVLRSFQMKAM